MNAYVASSGKNLENIDIVNLMIAENEILRDEIRHQKLFIRQLQDRVEEQMTFINRLIEKMRLNETRT